MRIIFWNISQTKTSGQHSSVKKIWCGRNDGKSGCPNWQKWTRGKIIWGWSQKMLFYYNILNIRQFNTNKHPISPNLLESVRKTGTIPFSFCYVYYVGVYYRRQRFRFITDGTHPSSNNMNYNPCIGGNGSPPVWGFSILETWLKNMTVRCSSSTRQSKRMESII